MPPMPAAVNDQSQYDKICKITFRNWDVYHEHKINNKKHITCDECSEDFKTNEGLNCHRKQDHPMKQCLNCPGCNELFIRLGSLVCHIENTQCQSLKKTDVKFNFNGSGYEKMPRAEKYRALRNFLEYGQTSGDFSDNEPMPKFKDEENNAAAYADSAKRELSTFIANEGTLIDFDEPVAPYVPEDEDLLSFDEPSQILNASWDQPISNANRFPALRAKNPNAVPDVPNPIPPFEINNAWGKKDNFFPNATAAVAPPTELLKSLSIEPKAVRSPFDPDNPEFRADRYYIDNVGKFRCPHLGCKKTLGNKSAFVQHLKSPTHRNLQLQCNKCFRYFSNATALTQHSEAQGVRCNIREADDYDAEVLQFTAGTAATAGLLEDSTVKYVVTNQLMPDASGSTGIVEANKAAAAAMAKKKESYWDEHTPIW